MTNQPTPQVSDADVERIARRDFDSDRAEHVLTTLQAYGVEAWHREPARVRLAVLKLSAGCEDHLGTHMQTAMCDYRDVLTLAEYPTYTKHVPGPGRVPGDEEQRIIDADQEQYRAWLAR